jgi:lysophospholipase L1-like esterase
MPHPWAGWVLIPHAHAELENEDRAVSKRVHVDYNGLGMRDVERSFAKPPGTFRVLMLGDSYLEAVSVAFDSILCRRLERALDGRGGRRVEVWNCGVSGYTTAEELLYLQHVVERSQPDLVVLCFLSGNDLADQVPELASSLRNRPFYHLSGDSLTLDRSRFKADTPVIEWLRVHSRLFGWVTTQRRVLIANLKIRAAARHPGRGIPPSLQIYAEHSDSLMSLAWAVTDRLIVAMRDEARKQGAEFLLVSVSNGVQENPQGRFHTPGWEHWTELRGLNIEEPERRLGALASANGIEYLPLLEAFHDEAARTGRPLHIEWTGHWNSSGNALAARVLAPRIAAHVDAVAGAASQDTAVTRTR